MNSRAIRVVILAAILTASAIAASAQQIGYVPGSDSGSSAAAGEESRGGSVLDHRKSYLQTHGRTYGFGLAGRGYAGPFTVGAGGVTGAPVDRALTVDEVRAFFERWVGAQEDAQLAVGKVEEQDDDTVIVEIVSKGEGGSVRRYAVDRHTGSYRPADG